MPTSEHAESQLQRQLFRQGVDNFEHLHINSGEHILGRTHWNMSCAELIGLESSEHSSQRGRGLLASLNTSNGFIRVLNLRPVHSASHIEAARRSHADYRALFEVIPMYLRFHRA